MSNDPSKWLVGDVVTIYEEVPQEDGEGLRRAYSAYKVVEVPAGHDDVTSNDNIKCQYFKPVGDDDVLKLCKEFYPFEASSLTNIDPDHFEIVEGELKKSVNQRKVCEDQN